MTHMHEHRLTPNQLVAAKLREARLQRGWTQEEAAARLEPYLGERWSVAVFSAAERSVAGKRVRQFTADDIAAFAKAFDMSPAWFVSEYTDKDLARDIEGARRVVSPGELRHEAGKLRERNDELRRQVAENESLAVSLSTLARILEQEPPEPATVEEAEALARALVQAPPQER
jgi:transcriptional regulator with XRE-family HTH domain